MRQLGTSRLACRAPGGARLELLVVVHLVHALSVAAVRELQTKPVAIPREKQVFAVCAIDEDGHLMNSMPITHSPFQLISPEGRGHAITIILHPEPEETDILDDHYLTKPPVKNVRFTIRAANGTEVFNHTDTEMPFSLFGASSAATALGRHFMGAFVTEDTSAQSNHSFLFEERLTLEATVVREGPPWETNFTVELEVVKNGSTWTASDLPLDGEWLGSLKAAAIAANMSVGTAICQAPVGAKGRPRCTYGGEPAFQKIVRQDFSFIAPERECKWSFTRTDPVTFDFTPCDLVMDLAVENRQKARFHALVWKDVQYGNLAEWLPQMSPDDIRDQLITHIEKMVARYRAPKYADTVFVWDVANEALDDDQDPAELAAGGWRMRPCTWSAIGDYVEVAFQTAYRALQEADKKHSNTTFHPIKLFYNDYAIESTAEDGDFARGKADALYNMMKSFKQRGIHVHGVGFQSHLNRRAAFHFDQSCEGATEERLERIADGMRENMRRLGALGLQVQFTEIDVASGYWGTEGKYVNCDAEGSGWDEVKEYQQARVYKHLMRVCLGEPNCSGFMTWGFVDKTSWLNRDLFAPAWPLLFDEDYRPKESYFALRDELESYTVNSTLDATLVPNPRFVRDTRTGGWRLVTYDVAL
ncbi:unnamed protein product [Vitrella brassicaformis CCMP3155]|uniref:endo-1,4-beta-xylanase n=1 Tax=Vitrella brassicaformis (strain CCMP3155) TaxID=1169540 RepID=A0A0G4FH44_VITBC|nr:unnamed protein product [Vitrella brassicaformis CCMP3155]|eukprot:CEM12178.1 unnamed protein product [Vitrella brassicaformis CCMP3155]